LQLLQDRIEITRKYFGCYQIDSVGCVSRSALKLADIHSIFTIAMQHKMQDFSGIFNGMDGQDLSFTDLYGGKGGFSDFVLCKYGPSIHRWWLLIRRGKKRPHLEGFKAFSEDRAVRVRSHSLPWRTGGVSGGDAHRRVVHQIRSQERSIHYTPGHLLV
jgi:hypothetical protein